MWVQDRIIRGVNLKDSKYKNWDTEVEAADMYKYVEDNKIKPERIYLDSITYKKRWSDLSAIEMAEFYMRITNTSLEYPIVIHYDWTIVDWYHRLVKALVEKRKYIMAYRIDVYQVNKKMIKWN